ncbi:hypothetical protein JCM16408A_39790 [Methylobacterium phyllosphaerae]
MRRYEIARWNGSISGAGPAGTPTADVCGVRELSSSIVRHMMSRTVAGKQVPRRSPRLREECDP